ncbi:MAG: EAL domain-containing protein [Betaproteobacteria bacterium]|nr:EAL domain-containing protein [Betaproteobacteria bacterium]
MAKILVVDDRPTNRQFLATLLGYASHSLFEAGNGTEALKQAHANRPDLVITDILMPSMDGYEFVQRLRADPDLARVPVIFYTATYSEPQAAVLAKSCGVRTVLPKPCEPEAILAAVQDALGAGDSAIAPLPGNAARPNAGQPVNDALANYANDLEAVKRKIDAISYDAERPLTKGDRERDLTHELAQGVTRLQRILFRLSALIEVVMEAGSERNPGRLVELFFGAACEIIPSRYAAIGVLDEHEQNLRYVFSKGIEARVLQNVDPRGPGLIDSIISGQRAVCLRSTEAGIGMERFPPGHPSIRNFIGVPVASNDKVYGWLYFADRHNEDEFTEEDERLAMILAARLAQLYENAMFYDVIQRHAAHLQLEVAERKQAEKDLAASEQRFRQIAENIRDVIFLIDPVNSRTLYVNPNFETVFGRNREEVYANPKNWVEAVHPDDRVRIEAQFREQRRTGRIDQSFRIVQPGGAVRWIRARGFPIEDAAGKPYRIAGIAEDITESKLAQEKIARLSRIYAVLSGINSTIVRMHDRNELFREACRIGVELGGFPLVWLGVLDRSAMQVKPIASQGSTREFIEFVADRLLVAEGMPGASGVVGRAIRDKKTVIVNDVDTELSTDPLRTERSKLGIRSQAVMPLVVSGEVAGVLALYAAEAGFFDEEEMKLLAELAGDIAFALDHIEKEERLHYLAYYDSLTGLANRTLFHERLDQNIQAAEREQQKFALLLLDIEHFKTINDTLGRHAGDDLLEQIADRIARCEGESKRIARVGADQFVTICTEVKTEEALARRVEEKLSKWFGQSFRLDDTALRISGKVGVAIYPDDGRDADTLFRNAEAALKKAKIAGEKYLFYTQQMNERAAERLALESKLQQALEKEEFVLYYQPKEDLESGRIVGVEALMRWASPEFGLVSPQDFIPTMEETGLILGAGAWALQRAALDHGRWIEQGVAAPRIAVNVSPNQLRRRDFVDVIRKSIAQGATPLGIDLEITEGLIMEDIQGNVEKLRALRDIGMSIAIDDFGTGYSSLAYLAKLPVQALKIDRSFIVSMLEDPDSMALVSMIITLAHALRLTVVAEGVDSPEQAKILRLLRCDQMQGYLVGRPVPWDDITALLASRKCQASGDAQRGA